ncbi:Protein max [Taenia crassiceps]|uniref:Protein max n=1 Tax=Taenia crassiceps TaxID=6207 RepID=A0ABR4QEV0_9CEST
MSHYASASKSYDEGDYAGDDDDMEDDDGYDCLSDYDGDMDGGNATVSGEGPSNGGDRRGDGYASRSSYHHGGKVSVGGNGRHRTDFRRYRNASDRVMPDHSDDNRRDHHNHLERKRRASIKGSYCDLREAIPSLRGSKASRAVTLQRAAEYIETLTKSNREHSCCVDELTRQNEILERQVQDLYRNYQRLENDEYALAQAAAVAQSGAPLNQTGVSGSFNAPPPPSTLAVTSSSPTTSSTGNSTPTTAAHAPNCGSTGSSCNSSTGFSIPVRVVSQHQPSTGSNASSPDDPPSTGIPSSGLAQLSYAALQLQQQQQSVVTPNTVATKPPVSLTTVVTTSPPPMARLITLESSNAVPSSASRGVVPQRIRLSNSLSTSSGGRPIVVVSTSSSPSGTPATSTTFSALDTAVLKARTARPPLDQQQHHHHHVMVGSNVEVVSSSTTSAVPISVASASNMASPTQVLGHPRRVVIVSAQPHQECPLPPSQAASIVSSKQSPH